VIDNTDRGNREMPRSINLVFPIRNRFQSKGARIPGRVITRIFAAPDRMGNEMEEGKAEI